MTKRFTKDFSFKLIDLGSDESEFYDEQSIEQAYEDYCKFWHNHGFVKYEEKHGSFNMDLG